MQCHSPVRSYILKPFLMHSYLKYVNRNQKSRKFSSLSNTQKICNVTVLLIIHVSFLNFNPLPPELFFRRFSLFSLRWDLFVYRLIVATLIGNFLMIPSKIKIESFVKRCHMGTLGGKGLMAACTTFQFALPVSLLNKALQLLLLISNSLYIYIYIYIYI